MHVWNVLHAARWKYSTQKWRKKIAIWAPSHNFVGLSSQLRHVSTIGKKNLLSSNIFSTWPYNMANFGPLAAEIVALVWGTPANFNGFRVLPALLHGILQQWASAKLRSVEHRAPPIFGRAAITLGIGPHSSWDLLRKARHYWGEN